MTCNGLRAQLRDFLHDSLYHPTEGYFSAQQPPVGVGKPLDLPSLSDEDAYRMEVRRQYDDLAVWPFRAHSSRCSSLCQEALNGLFLP